MKKLISVFAAAAICSAAFAQQAVDVQDINAQLAAISAQLNEIRAAQLAPSSKGYLLGQTIPGQEAKSPSAFFWGLKGGVFLDKGNVVDENGTVSDTPTTFSFTIKPSFGVYLSPRWVVGVKGEFSYNNNDMDSGFISNVTSGFSQVSFRNVLSNMILGNGLGNNYLSWKVLPYARYKVTSLFSDKINLWMELELYAGQKFSKDTENGGYGSPYTIFGGALSPMLSYDLNESLMLCFTPDFIRWDGTFESGSGMAANTGSFSAQLNPLYMILSGIINIGVIKRF